VNLELSFVYPSTTLYLKPLHLARPPHMRLGSAARRAAAPEGEVLMGITKVEVSGHPALACGGCGEIILFLGRERDWYEPDANGRLRNFLCSGCGAELTLANQTVEVSCTAPHLGRKARPAPSSAG